MLDNFKRWTCVLAAAVLLIDWAAAQRPNVVVLLADDLGYGDLGVYGHETIRTPNIDRLADEGTRFTACYAAAPMCSPSRAGLLTGRSPHRAGIYDWIPHDGASDVHLKATEISFASLMRGVGYQTSLHGKWHLNSRFNDAGQPQPNDHGFQYWFATQFNPPHFNPPGFCRNGVALPAQAGYACQIVVDDALRWLRTTRVRNRPFMQFLSFHEPHHPVMSPPDLVAAYLRSPTQNQNEAIYFANVANLDRAVGRYLDGLADLGLASDTLVIFTSDHGPQTLGKGVFRHSYGSAGPLRGRKRSLWEGGLRVPTLMRWPGKIAAGKTLDAPIGLVDCLPTFAQLCGYTIPQDRRIDGVDLTPLFEGRPVRRRTPLHWHFYNPLSGPQSALRHERWMLTAAWSTGGKPFAKGTRHIPSFEYLIRQAELQDFRLYDSVEDLHQDVDIAAEHPHVVEGLSSQLIRLHAEVREEAPLWAVKPSGNDVQ